MSDDVHDIDNLFKGKLEEYVEEAPPAAWEAVNYALDRQQATLYKSKYNRLKRAALALSILCFLGGMYIAYDVWQHQQISSENKQPSTTSSINKTNENPVDNKNGNAGDVIQNNNQQKKNEQKQKTFLDEDSASVNNNVLVQKQKKKRQEK